MKREKEKQNKTSPVGQAVSDILKKENNTYEVGEIIDEYANKYVEEMQKAVSQNVDKFESPFYIVVLHKKEPWALNVLRNWFVVRQTKPSIHEMWGHYRNFMHTIYRFDKRSEKLELMYSLPSPDEASLILKNWHLYDADLVRWCYAAKEEMRAGPSQVA